MTTTTQEALAAKLENIISGHKINDDDADWLRSLSQPAVGEAVAHAIDGRWEHRTKSSTGGSWLAWEASTEEAAAAYRDNPESFRWFHEFRYVTHPPQPESATTGAQPLPAQQEPDGTLHDDGYYTWRAGHPVPRASHVWGPRPFYLTPPAPSEPAQPAQAGEPAALPHFDIINAICRMALVYHNEALEHQISRLIEVLDGDQKQRLSNLLRSALKQPPAAPASRLVFSGKSTPAPGEPAGAQAGAEWVEEAMRLAELIARAHKMAGLRAGEPARRFKDEADGYREALRAHLTTMAAIPEAKEKPNG